jgi:hypothetical protein
MKLKVFYHIVDLPGWQEIFHEQINELKSSGLADIAEIRLCCNFDAASFADVQKEYSNEKNFIWSFDQNDPRDYESPTLRQLYLAAQEEDFYALYLHMKGVSYVGTGKEQSGKNWRHLLNYWNISRWRDCVAKLDEGFDHVGCQLSSIFVNHFSGNIWWVKSGFVRQCRPFPVHHENNFVAQLPHGGRCKFDDEFWLGSHNPKMHSLFNFINGHYEDCVPCLYFQG